MLNQRDEIRRAARALICEDLAHRTAAPDQLAIDIDHFDNRFYRVPVRRYHTADGGELRKRTQN
jgi:hypothetical protein